LEQGLEQGREEERKNIVINLLKNNVDIEIIVMTTGLSKEAILKIKEGE
jgi:hypothetical protein